MRDPLNKAVRVVAKERGRTVPRFIREAIREACRQHLQYEPKHRELLLELVLEGAEEGRNPVAVQPLRVPHAPDYLVVEP